MPNAKPLFSPDKTSAPIRAPFSFLFDISKDKTFESRSGDYVIDRRLTFDDHPRCSRDLEHLDFMDIRRLKCSRAERPIGMNYRPEGTSRAVPETLQGGPPKTIQSVGHFRPGLLCPRFHGGATGPVLPSRSLDRNREDGSPRTDDAIDKPEALWDLPSIQYTRENPERTARPCPLYLNSPKASLSIP